MANRPIVPASNCNRRLVLRLQPRARAKTGRPRSRRSPRCRKTPSHRHPREQAGQRLGRQREQDLERRIRRGGAGGGTECREQQAFDQRLPQQAPRPAPSARRSAVSFRARRPGRGAARRRSRRRSAARSRRRQKARAAARGIARSVGLQATVEMPARRPSPANPAGDRVDICARLREGDPGRIPRRREELYPRTCSNRARRASKPQDRPAPRVGRQLRRRKLAGITPTTVAG